MQVPLITRRDVLNHGLGSAFLAQFDLRPIDVTIETGGALGTATVKWRVHGELDYSAAKLSNAGASWTWELPDPAYALVTLPAAAYIAGDAWTIDTLGSVVAQTGVHAITAVRNDVVAEVIDGVSSDIATWTQPRVVPPIVSLGPGQKGWAAKIAAYRLKSRQGMTPAQAGTGDENLRLLAEDAQRDFERIGRSDNRPPDLIDSSSNNQGRGIPLMPRSRSPRGFGDFS